MVIVSDMVVLSGVFIQFRTFQENIFAAATIGILPDQKVISTGPYALVRHPMYLGMALTALGAPLALGSYIAVPVFALFIPVLIYRLIHEERTLRRDLPGYAEYCERTGFRLVPWVW